MHADKLAECGCRHNLAFCSDCSIDSGQPAASLAGSDQGPSRCPRGLYRCGIVRGQSPWHVDHSITPLGAYCTHNEQLQMTETQPAQQASINLRMNGSTRGQDGVCRARVSKQQPVAYLCTTTHIPCIVQPFLVNHPCLSP